MPIYPIGIVVIFANLFTTHTIMDCTISLQVEIPESLHEKLKTYLDKHPSKNQDDAIKDGLVLFLALGHTDMGRHHLSGLFSEVV